MDQEEEKQPKTNRPDEIIEDLNEKKALTKTSTLQTILLDDQVKAVQQYDDAPLQNPK